MEGRFVRPRPNPKADNVEFAFSHTKSGTVVIRIFNLSGQLIAELQGKLAGQSGQTIIWNTRAVPAGVYLAQVVINGQEQAKVKVAIGK
jgi:hypothetical protein